MWIIKEYAKAIIALAVLGFLLWFQAVYEFSSLPASTGQMEPAIPANSFYMLDQSFRSPDDFRHEDIVFFSFQTQKSTEIYASRVVGLPGDSLVMRDGELVRNGDVVEETYLTVPLKGIRLEKISVPRGHFYVLNDCRGQLNDSRSIGPLPWTAVFGRARK